MKFSDNKKKLIKLEGVHGSVDGVVILEKGEKVLITNFKKGTIISENDL